MHFQIKSKPTMNGSFQSRNEQTIRLVPLLLFIIVRPSIDHRLQVSLTSSQRHPPVIITTKQYEVIDCIHRGTGHHRIGGGRDEQNAGADTGRIPSAGHGTAGGNAAADHAIPHREQHCYAGARGSTLAPLHGKLVMVISPSPRWVYRHFVRSVCIYCHVTRPF